MPRLVEFPVNTETNTNTILLGLAYQYIPLENVAAIQRKITRVDGVDSNGNIRELDITIDASLFSIT